MRQLAFAIILAVSLLSSGCALIPGHKFVDPARDWNARSGQLAYHGRHRVIIGEVLVRFSARGDFELTFTKGPGLVLLLMRTDPEFARVQGAMVGLPWSGQIAQAPPRMKGWLQLRDRILRSPKEKTVRVNEAGDTFLAHF